MARKKEEEIIEAIAPDPVLDTLKRWEDWAEKHLKQIAAGLAVVLGGVLAWQLVEAKFARDASVVTTDLSKAVTSYEEVTSPQKILSSTVAGALDAELMKAREPFSKLAKEHGATGAGKLALLYEADLARRANKHAEAAELYESYLKGAAKDDAMLFLAIEGAGYALEEQGKLDEAAERFGRLTTEPGTAFYKDYGLKHRARILEKKGDKAGAIEAYKAIVAQEPVSDLKSFAEERLKLLQ
jgi:predicted negative regulator of RcsB-dependent stress response